MAASSSDIPNYDSITRSRMIVNALESGNITTELSFATKLVCRDSSVGCLVLLSIIFNKKAIQ